MMEEYSQGEFNEQKEKHRKIKKTISSRVENAEIFEIQRIDQSTENKFI